MAIRQKMYQPKVSELNPDWRVMDAAGKTLGRLSSEIATMLQGKHRPQYVPYMNTGDYVIVINAEKISVTGDKLEQKKYYRHSGYHGGLKESTLKDMLDKHPERVLKQSVKGMLPKNIPGRRMLSRLKIYSGDEHPHQAQVASSNIESTKDNSN
jgi:large subunit ribosomal protein L13